MHNHLIRASEVGEYVYCHRAWWLRHVQGVESANQAALAAGRQAHGRHARRVQTSALAARVALALIALAGLLLALAVLL
ncbi:MAG: Dna2/Cas4 domain-containing protein [Ardenticatenaceae bacterium]|nr:Dna2/Cas4 domain-containing protein [Ardenticatenaceae bacterium]